MKRIKYLLIAATLLCSTSYASNQDTWDEMVTNPLLNEPKALHTLITWMDPVVIVLPQASLHNRCQLVSCLVDHYNDHLKPTVDRRLMNLFISYPGHCTVDMHKYMTESLERFVSRFMDNLIEDDQSDLIPANFYIASNGCYEFVNQN